MNKWMFLIIAVDLLFSGMAHAMCGGPVPLYYKANDGWHYGDKKIEGADSASFHVLSGSTPDTVFIPCAVDSGYAADKFHVYSGAGIFPGAEPATFSLLADGYARDTLRVYYLGKILNGADAKTFGRVGLGSFYRDSAHVYRDGTILRGADPATFSTASNKPFPSSDLAHDASHVYFRGSPIPVPDAKDVKLLSHDYWISHQSVFYTDKPVTQADAATFSAADDNETAFLAEDKDHYFWEDRAVNKPCRKEGEIVMACKDFILVSGQKNGRFDAASFHYLGRFPLRASLPSSCQVAENSMIYQDSHGIYLFYGDGRIWKFLSSQQEKRFQKLDKALEDRLCNWPTQSLTD